MRRPVPGALTQARSRRPGRRHGSPSRGFGYSLFHCITALCVLCCSSICQSFSADAAVSWADGQSFFSVRPLAEAAPEYLGERCFEEWSGNLVVRKQAGGFLLAGFALWSRGVFVQWPLGRSLFRGMQADGQQQQPASVPAPGAAAGAGLGAEQIDRLVRQRLDQAFSSVFGWLVESSERAAVAAEKQANVARNDNLVRSLKCHQWRPQSREEELRTWREWFFGFTNYVAGHDPLYESELREMDVDKETTAS